MTRSLLLLPIALLLSVSSFGGNTLVNSVSAFNTALAGAQPGDTITLANQTWTNAAIFFSGKNGTPSLPIVVRAEKYGNVIFTGSSYFRIYGQYLRVEGIIFRNVVLTTGGIVEFRNGSSQLASNCRLTRCAFVNCNPASTTTNYNWVLMYGQYNRVDHCYFRGKNHQGPTLAVVRNAHTPDYQLIDSNYFAYRPPLGDNGGETIRLGTSTYSLSASRTKVEYNYFERCNGEIETISNKSCENIIRYNTFYENQGTITLRHGNRCQVYGNFFFGRRVSNTGGIRVIGEDHLIYNNYISGTTGNDTRSALSIMNGLVVTDTTDPSQLSGYFPVKRAKIIHNTFVDCKYNLLIGAGRSSTQNVKPDQITFANNVMRSVSGNITSPMIVQTDTATNMVWQGNFVSSVSVGISPVPSGISTTDPLLSSGADGFYRPASNSPLINAALGSYPDVTTDMDGQTRESSKDVGADEVLSAPTIIRPVTAADTGPGNVAVSTGNWNDTLTWMYNAVPTSSDDVLIIAGVAVTVNINNAACRSLTIEGTLSFSNSTTGRSLAVGGDLLIQPGGTLNTPAKASTGTELLHTLSLNGNLTNNGTFDMRGGSGTTAGSNTINAVNITFSGAASSIVSMGAYSSSNNEFNGISINKTSGARVILNGDMILNSSGTVNPPNVSLTSGILETGNNKFILLSNGASFGSGSTTSYVLGSLGRAFPSGGGTKSYPIGDAAGFRPVSVNTSTTGIVSGHYLLVTPAKSPASTGISTFAGGIDFVSNVRYWKIEYFKNTSTTASLTLNNFSISYGSDDKLIPGSMNFRVAYSADNRSLWNNIGPSNHTVSIGASPATIQSDIISGGPPVLADSEGIYLAIAKTTGSSGFETPLRLSAVPEGLVSENSIIEDTLTVELHSSQSPYTVVASSTAFSDSLSTRFGNLRIPVPSMAYIVVKTRNALETWSANPVDFTPDSVAYNFTQSQSGAYGGNLQLKNGLWCLYSGDINGDLIIDFSDVAAVDSDGLAYTTGYVPTDLTGDGFVDFSDLIIADNNSLNFVMTQKPLSRESSKQ